MDRSSRRYRGTRGDLLPTPGRLQTGLLPISKTPYEFHVAGRQWPTGLIREFHTASRGTYGYRRIHAELTIGMEIPCSSRLISVLMTKSGISGLPGPARVKRLKGDAAADDLVHRKFHRVTPDELPVPDITEHPTREGKVFCAAVLDTRRGKIDG